MPPKKRFRLSNSNTKKANKKIAEKKKNMETCAVFDCNSPELLSNEVRFS